MAAGFYTIVSRSDGHAPVVVVAGKTAFQTSAQARGHVLCWDCEQRFNVRGENWVIENCWQSAERFPLHGSLQSVGVAFSTDGYDVYQGEAVPGADLPQLTYFASSMLWRASVPGWRLGREPVERIELGPFGEQLRLYLLDKAEFPKHVVLNVFVSKTANARHNLATVLPHPLIRNADYKSYRLNVPGLTFWMSFGQRIPADLRSACTGREGWLYMSDDVDSMLERRLSAWSRQAERKGRLRSA